jgi:hypothetical protein
VSHRRGEVTHRELRQQGGEEHRRRNDSAHSVARNANFLVQLQSSPAICTPSFNEHCECPGEGWPRERPGRSLFADCNSNKLVNLPNTNAAAALRNANFYAQPPTNEAHLYGTS